MLISILILFAFGAVAGWVIEVVYRSFNQRKLVNPGFLSGPYLPLYGFGVLILYYISSLEVNFVIRILLFFVIMTLLELVTGIIFISYYKIKLWDYSNKFMNYKGLICLEFSIYWTWLALGFYYFVYPFLKFLFFSSVYLILLLGVFYGIFLLDLFSTLGVAQRVRKLILKKKSFVNYYLFKEFVTLGFFRKNHKYFFRKFFLPVQSLKLKNLEKSLDNFMKKKN